MIIIGGPHDGQDAVVVEGVRSLRLVAPTEFQAPKITAEAPQPGGPAIAEYVRRSFRPEDAGHAEREARSFWVWDGLKISAAEALVSEQHFAGKKMVCDG